MVSMMDDPSYEFGPGPPPANAASAGEWVFIAVLFTTATVFSGLRLASYFTGKTPSFGKEDGVHLAALLAYYGLLITEAVGLALVEYWDSGQVPESQASVAFQALWARNQLYSLANGLVKISILLFFIRLFRVSQRFALVAWTLVAFSSVWTIFDFTIPLSVCSPIRAYWSTDDHFYFEHCDDARRGRLQAISSTINFGLEFLICALPLPMIYNLRAKRARKLQYLLFLSLGLAILAVSLASAVSLILEYLVYANTDHFSIPYGIRVLARYRYVMETGVAVSVSAALGCGPIFRSVVKSTAQLFKPLKTLTVARRPPSDQVTEMSSADAVVMHVCPPDSRGTDAMKDLLPSDHEGKEEALGPYTGKSSCLADTRVVDKKLDQD